MVAFLPLLLAFPTGCGGGGKSAGPTERDGVDLIPAATGTHAPFSVGSRIPHLEAGWDWPCADCHEGQPPDPTVRELVEEHEFIPLDHGDGRFWCTACHYNDDKEYLVDGKGEPVHYDESYKVCGQCHYEKERDFYRGAHGKRIGNWMGDRELTACVECHDPHAPAIEPREPLAPPSVRKGLTRDHKEGHAHPAPWEQILDRRLDTYGEAFFEEQKQ